MARRRKGLIATLFPKAYRSYRRARRGMRPDRVVVRVLSLDEAWRGIKSLFKPRTKMSPAARRKQLAAMHREAAGQRSPRRRQP